MHVSHFRSRQTLQRRIQLHRNEDAPFRDALDPRGSPSTPHATTGFGSQGRHAGRDRDQQGKEQWGRRKEEQLQCGAIQIAGESSQGRAIRKHFLRKNNLTKNCYMLI